jgi:1-acyl-sn-glycerol-3-phosphate acyltransferase
MNIIRGISRILAMIGTTIYHIFRILISKDKGQAGYHHAHIWAQKLTSIMGLEIEVQGNIPTTGGLVLGNHRSYSDIMVMMNFLHCSFVAKAELQSWPIIGFGARVAGNIFVNRSDPNSRKQTVLDIKEKLKQGYTVTVFPEGTTFEGPLVKEFKHGTFKIAAEGGIPVSPVAIEYQNINDAWVGDDLFAPHFFRTFGRKKTKVKVRFGETIQSDNFRELSDKTKGWIVDSLVEMRSQWDKEAKG